MSNGKFVPQVPSGPGCGRHNHPGVPFVLSLSPADTEYLDHLARSREQTTLSYASEILSNHLADERLRSIEAAKRVQDKDNLQNDADDSPEAYPASGNGKRGRKSKFNEAIREAVRKEIRNHLDEKNNLRRGMANIIAENCGVPAYEVYRQTNVVRQQLKDNNVIEQDSTRTRSKYIITNNNDQD